MKKLLFTLFLFSFLVSFVQAQQKYTLGQIQIVDSNHTAKFTNRSVSSSMFSGDTLALNGQRIMIDNLLFKPDSVKYVSKNFANDSSKSTFSTINAAVTKSGSGTLIYVYPGSYNEAVTGKNGVNIYLAAGASIDYSGAGSAFLADGISCIIAGEGSITNTGSTREAIKITNNANVVVKCRYVYSKGLIPYYPFSGSAIIVKNSSFQIFCDQVESRSGAGIFLDTGATGIINVRNNVYSHTGNSVAIASNREIDIVNTSILSDSGVISTQAMTIYGDSSKVYLSHCRIETLDYNNSRPAVDIKSHLSAVYASATDFIAGDAVETITSTDTTAVPVYLREGCWGNSNTANIISVVGSWTYGTTDQIVKLDRVTATSYENSQIITILDGNIDATTGNFFYVPITGNQTITFTGLPAVPKTIVILMGNDATDYAVAWDSRISWDGGSPPSRSGANKLDVFTFMVIDDTHIFGAVKGDYDNPF